MDIRFIALGSRNAEEGVGVPPGLDHMLGKRGGGHRGVLGCTLSVPDAKGFRRRWSETGGACVEGERGTVLGGKGRPHIVRQGAKGWEPESGKRARR